MGKVDRERDLPPIWCYIGGMPSLTLKDLPSGLHRELKARAERHRRSLNGEAIACLEAAVTVERVDVDALLARARQARRRVRGAVSASDIRQLKRTGRP
jgi:plasmid stability protein